ncbi:MAG: DNA-binding domain-containing protein [Nitratireductor sp.]
MRLAELQQGMQADILARSTAIAPELKVRAGASPEKRLGIYQDAYKLRLIDITRTYHPILLAYMGDEAFQAMTSEYFDHVPSNHANARHVARRLPHFLQTAPSYSAIPSLAEIAALERAIEDVFDATDSAVATLADLQAIDPQAVESLRVIPIPAMELVRFATNGYDIFLALKQETVPSTLAHPGETTTVLVWRADETSRFRKLGAEEAMLFTEVAKGSSFATLCEMAAFMDGAETAAARVASYLVEWLNSGLVSRLEA